MEHQNPKPEKYQCPRCGAETTLPSEVRRCFCSICGVFGWELNRVGGPRESGVHRLPVR